MRMRYYVDLKDLPVRPACIAATLFLFVLAGCSSPNEDPGISVPDQALLEAILQQGADTNGDGKISRQEAGKVMSLTLPPSGIRSLKGLDAFTNLDTLVVTLNPLDSLFMAHLPGVSYLDCSSCQLVWLDLQGNPGLRALHCGRNPVGDLDPSPCPFLRELVCNNTGLVSLDLSANPYLETLVCCGNQLEQLDLSAQPGLKKIGIDNMPMLEEVCVWVLPFPPPGVQVLMDYSPNVSFTTDCD